MKTKTGIPDLAVKQSAARLVKGGEVRGQHYPEVTLDFCERRALGAVATSGAVAAGAGAAVPK